MALNQAEGLSLSPRHSGVGTAKPGWVAALSISAPSLRPSFLLGSRPGLPGRRPSSQGRPKPAIVRALAQPTQTCWTRALSSQMASIRHTSPVLLDCSIGAMEENVTLQSAGLEGPRGPPASHRDLQTDPPSVPQMGSCPRFWATPPPQGGVSGGPAWTEGRGLIILSVLGDGISLAVNKGF